MASEEERAAIMAEYNAAFEDDDEEADFDPSNFDDDDDSEEGSSEDDEEEDEGKPRDHAVLTGSIHLNEEGRVIYSGTWCMKSETNKAGASLDEKLRKKHPKFKLKSQAACHPPPCPTSNGGSNDGKPRRGALFDARRPTLSKIPPTPEKDDGDAPAVALPTRRTMIFDGFFFEPPPPATTAEGAKAPPSSPDDDATPKKHPHHHHHPHGRKIKERDVELFFTTAGHDEITNGGPAEAEVAYKVSGRGHNEYGPFVLDGTYTPPPSATKTSDGNGTNIDSSERKGSKHHHKHSKGLTATIACSKTYGVGGAAKATKGGAAKGARRSKRNRKDDDSFDDDFGDEKADYGEVAELYDDATLSIEQLRKKYYGGGDDEEEGDGGGKVAPAKRPKLDDSDDECGF